MVKPGKTGVLLESLDVAKSGAADRDVDADTAPTAATTAGGRWARRGGRGRGSTKSARRWRHPSRGNRRRHRLRGVRHGPGLVPSRAGMTSARERTTFQTWEVPSWAPFDSLSGRDVHDLLALRQEVFVVEQRCLYVDADGLDLGALHLLVRDARSPSSVLLAAARVLAPGVRFAERSVGRVVVRASARGPGLGRALMVDALRRIEAMEGREPVRLAAQAHLERFYASLGFVRVSDVFDEDGIPHIEMLRVR